MLQSIILPSRAHSMPIRREEYLNVSEAAAFLGISRSTFYRLWENGGLEGVEVYRPTPRRPMFRRADLEKWIASHGGKLEE